MANHDDMYFLDKDMYSSNTVVNTGSTVIDVESKGNFTASSTADMKPNDIFALARAFLCIAPMTHKKLQKLCYYAKAWYLAIYDTNIVSESFEAWVHGAVQPDLYRKYRIYGFSNIPQETDKSNIPEEFLSFAQEVYDAYGHLTGDELEKLNHSEEPWQIAREGRNPWESCENVISEDSMKQYYRKRLKQQ